MSDEKRLSVADGRKIYPDKMRFFLHHYGVAALISALFFLLGFAAAFAMVPGGSTVALGAWAVATIIMGGAVAHTVLYCQTTTMYLTAEEVVYETGIVEHQKTRVPLHMITDTKLNRDLADKIFGTATIMVNTSGGSGYEIMATLEHHDLEEMHAEIYRLVRKTAQSVPDKESKK